MTSERASYLDTEYFGFENELGANGVLTVTFNRPESMNASNHSMKRDLIELITQVQMDDAVRVVVFTGKGRAFWAGDDLGGYEAERPSSMPEIFGGHHNAAGTYNSLRRASRHSCPSGSPSSTSGSGAEKLSISTETQGASRAVAYFRRGTH